MIDETINFISRLGFPMFVAVYTLFRLEKKMSDNTKAINAMLSFIKQK